MDLASIRAEVSGWGKRYQKLFIEICEDLDGAGEKEDILRTAHRILAKKRANEPSTIDGDQCAIPF